MKIHLDLDLDRLFMTRKYQTSIRREGNNNFTVTISAPQPVQAEKGHKEHSAVAKDTVITLKNASFEANTVQANVDGRYVTVDRN